ncbi:MAG: PucR family transcriptional regulator [Actinophytocola sp.]|nr:PucR family transcriptional regulator [Actinophytocola sp.]
MRCRYGCCRHSPRSVSGSVGDISPIVGSSLSMPRSLVRKTVGTGTDSGHSHPKRRCSTVLFRADKAAKRRQRRPFLVRRHKRAGLPRAVRRWTAVVFAVTVGAIGSHSRKVRLIVRTPSHTVLERPGSLAEQDVDRYVALVASLLNEQLADITATMRDVLYTQIGELRGDESLLNLLGASIEGNVETILHILQYDIADEHVEPPSAAFEYARRLAQRGVPVNALVRAYRLGQDHLLKRSFEAIQATIAEPAIAFCASQRFVSTTFNYVDWISQHIVSVYESERERWLENRSAVRAARIKELIGGKTADTDRAEENIGYSLRQRHVGVVLWIDEESVSDSGLSTLERWATTLGECLGSRGKPLVVACDRTSVWAWLPFGHRDTFDPAAVRVFAEADAAAPRIAFGEPVAGVDGFRETHRQALRAQALALAGGADPVIGFGEPGVAAACLLSANLPSTRAWVQRVLGRLALADDQHGRLRDTVRVFLAEGGSYTAAAERLTMHKNSVKYRVARAEEERGRPISDDRLDVELALLACRWLGDAIYTEPR